MRTDTRDRHDQRHRDRRSRPSLEFPPPGLNEEQTLSLDDRWLVGAELVIVRATQARAFDRRLEIAGFPLKLDSAVADEEVR